jgi:hypothetical protein
MGGYMIPLAGQPAPRENPTQAYQAGAQSYLQQQEMQQQTSNLAQQQQLIQQEAQSRQLQNQQLQFDMDQNQRMAGVLRSNYSQGQPGSGSSQGTSTEPVATNPALSSGTGAVAPYMGQPAAPQGASTAPARDPGIVNAAAAPNYLSSGVGALSPYLGQSPVPAPPAASPSASPAANASIPAAYSAPAAGNPMAAAVLPPPPEQATTTATLAAAPTTQSASPMASTPLNRIQQLQDQFAAAGVLPQKYIPIIKSLTDTAKNYADAGTAANDEIIKSHSILNGNLMGSFATLNRTTGAWDWQDPTPDQWTNFMASQNFSPQDRANIDRLHPPGQPPSGAQLEGYSHTLYLDTQLHAQAKDDIANQGNAQKNVQEAKLALLTVQEAQGKLDLQGTQLADAKDKSVRDAAGLLANAKTQDDYTRAFNNLPPSIQANALIPAPGKWNPGTAASLRQLSLTGEQATSLAQSDASRKVMEAIAQQNADTRKNNAANNPNNQAANLQSFMTRVWTDTVNAKRAAGIDPSQVTPADAVALLKDPNNWGDQEDIAAKRMALIGAFGKANAADLNAANVQARTAATTAKTAGATQTSPLQNWKENWKDINSYLKANPGKPTPDDATLSAWKASPSGAKPQTGGNPSPAQGAGGRGANNPPPPQAGSFSLHLSPELSAKFGGKKVLVFNGKDAAEAEANANKFATAAGLQLQK